MVGAAATVVVVAKGTMDFQQKTLNVT